ncbi:MAG TPA: hypothetical protein VK988_12395 [Acidimicrobiales bacterium]|nr:hypothetical protein [Acidimicrobiales bacterium]
MESDGLNEAEVLATLPYDETRALGRGTGVPSARRYRAGRQMYQTIGLLYEDESGIVRVTEFGLATLRWLNLLHEGNVPVLGRHAAFALAACQLRNPTGDGESYDPVMEVFPFAFIWRVMLALDNRIASDELNRAVLQIRTEDDLGAAIDAISRYRRTGNLDDMGSETVTGDGKNDRIISWMAAASFGWTLISDKRESADRTYYQIRDRTLRVLEGASRVRHPHRDYGSTEEYVEHLARCAALPKDLR